MAFYKDRLLNSSVTKGTILLSVTFIAAIILGLTLSHLNDMKEIENLLETKRPSKPSLLYDRNGLLITEYYSDEKKDLITIDEVPEYLIQALILWEDEDFYHHKGFNIFAILRASLNNLVGKPVSGASTLTQQLARTLFLTSRFSWARKFRELWIALQLEKKYTKNEILTLYLNHVPLGSGINGVGAASKYYFNKDIKELDYSESASLITIISNPTYYSFIKFPKNHKQKQKSVLNKMVKNGVITELESENSFNKFWLNWQSTANSARGAFFNREDKAPFFSEWVMNKINADLPNVDIFKDGLVIYSTLDLKMNLYVEEMMKEVIQKQQKIFEEYQSSIYSITQDKYIDAVDLLSNTFALININTGKNRNLKRGITDYNRDINLPLNLISQTLGLNSVDTLTEIMSEKEGKSKDLLAQVQGAFIAMETTTGQIIAMIGGNNFDPNHRFNYAMQSMRQPGSAFKPFVYSAALDTGTYTAASILTDKPVVFTFDSEDQDEWYEPYNYGGRYYGKVSLRKALRRSLNIPSCQIFYNIGYNNHYKAPLDRAALLLGINSQEEIDQRFKPEISTVLGTGSVSPVEMASAFAVFGNQGKKIIPNSILRVEDRDGNIIYDPWKELDKFYRENSSKLQVITPQNAFIITDILKGVIDSPDGTLAFAKYKLQNQDKVFPKNVDFAAKTGTTQNWSDAWTIGFSPIITACGWVGFNKYGLSLGYEQPGATVMGPTWLEFMRKYHENMSNVKFKQPERLVVARVCKESGLQPSEYCSEDDIYVEYFLPGTVPVQKCNYCKQNLYRVEKNTDSIYDTYEKTFNSSSLDNLIGGTSIKVDNSILKKFNTGDSTLDIDSTLTDIDLFDDDDSPIDDIDLDTELNKKNKNNIIKTNDNTSDQTKDATSD